ncbi:MAG: hypothetical protein RBU37_26170 [Myxococcota bacterium]|nr:hypothetical protein [Myxococcota bacterium]
MQCSTFENRPHTPSMLATLAGLLVLSLVACSSTPTAPALSTLLVNDQAQRELTPNSVVVFEAGFSEDFDASELVPLMSEGEGYNEKWEFILTTTPYEARIRFEVSNLGLGDFKGKVSGRVKDRSSDDGPTYSFSDSFGEGKWSFEKNGTFAIEMGAWSVKGKPGQFSLRGVAGSKSEVSFEYDVEGSSWRPGSGISFFGDKYAQYMKSQVPLFHGKAKGVVSIDKKEVPVEGLGYANHLGSNLGMHEMAKEFYHFRKHDQDLYIEWRHVESTEQYRQQPIPFLVVAYQGTVLFESTEVELIPENYWTDPGNFGYTIVHGLRVEARDGENLASLRFTPGEVQVSDPLARVSKIERSIALQFTKPMDYTIKGPWRLDLEVDGMQATLRGEGSYSITRLQ